jgi:hypothetical protein
MVVGWRLSVVSTRGVLAGQYLDAVVRCPLSVTFRKGDCGLISMMTVFDRELVVGDRLSVVRTSGALAGQYFDAGCPLSVTFRKSAAGSDNR